MSTPDIGSNTEPENTSNGTSNSQTPGDTIKPNRNLLLAIASGLSLFLLLASWAWIVPPKSAPDDDFHLTTTWCAWGDSPYCIVESAGTVRVPQQLIGVNCRNFDFTTADVNCEWSAPFTYESTDRFRSSSGYNWPLYYVTHRVFVGDDIYSSTLRMRLFNASLASVLFGLAFLLSTPYIRRGLALAWIVAISPLVAFTIVSTSPQSWAVIGGSLSWVFFAALLTTPKSDRLRLSLSIAATLVTLIMAASARSDAALYIAVSYAAAVLIHMRDFRHYAKRLFLVSIPLVILLVIGFVPRASSVAATATAPLEQTQAVNEPLLLTAMLAGLPGFLAGLTGFFPASQTPWNGLVSFGLGWEGFPSPSAAYIPLLLAIGALAMWGLHRISKGRLLAIALMIVILVAVPVATVVSFNFSSGVQLRYFLPLILVILAVLFMAEEGPQSHLGRAQVAFIAAATFIGGSIAFTSALVRYRFGLTELWDIHWARVWVDMPEVAEGGSMAFTVIAGAASLAIFITVALLQLRETNRDLLDTQADPVTHRPGSPN